MDDTVGNMAQMEAMIQALRNGHLTLLQQQQETLLHTATTSSMQNVHMERLIGVLAGIVRVPFDSNVGGRQGCWQTECLPER